MVENKLKEIGKKLRMNGPCVTRGQGTEALGNSELICLEDLDVGDVDKECNK